MRKITKSTITVEDNDEIEVKQETRTLVSSIELIAKDGTVIIIQMSKEKFVELDKMVHGMIEWRGR